jgi:hypothetical protein
MEQQQKKQVHPGYKAAEAFAGVTELLCTTEAFFLSRLSTLTQPELEKARKEAIQIQHIAGQIRNRISEEISDRYQEWGSRHRANFLQEIRAVNFNFLKKIEIQFSWNSEMKFVKFEFEFSEFSFSFFANFEFQISQILKFNFAKISRIWILNFANFEIQFREKVFQKSLKLLDENAKSRQRKARKSPDERRLSSVRRPRAFLTKAVSCLSDDCCLDVAPVVVRAQDVSRGAAGAAGMCWRTGFPWASSRQPRVKCYLSARCLLHSSCALRGARFGPAVVGRVSSAAGPKSMDAPTVAPSVRPAFCVGPKVGFSVGRACIHPAGAHSAALEPPALRHALLTVRCSDSRFADCAPARKSPRRRTTGFTLAALRPLPGAALSAPNKQPKAGPLRGPARPKTELETPKSFTMIAYGTKFPPNERSSNY